MTIEDVQTETGFVEETTLPFSIDLTKTAIVVIDMQNTFAGKHGYFDRLGIDLDPIRKVIPPCRKIMDAGRELNLKIVYLKMGCDDQHLNRLTPNVPRYYKSPLHSLIQSHPELKDSLYLDDTWGSEIIDELKPRPEDTVLVKYTHDGFIGSGLDRILEDFGIRYLIFIGLATNICIESTLRHAYFLDYFSILVSDCVHQKGPPLLQQATLMNVQSTFGWVLKSDTLLRLFPSHLP